MVQLFHIPQCSIKNRNIHISALKGALWDMERVHFGICEIGLLQTTTNHDIHIYTLVKSNSYFISNAKE